MKRQKRISVSTIKKNNPVDKVHIAVLGRRVPFMQSYISDKIREKGGTTTDHRRQTTDYITLNSENII